MRSRVTEYYNSLRPGILEWYDMRFIAFQHENKKSPPKKQTEIEWLALFAAVAVVQP